MKYDFIEVFEIDNKQICDSIIDWFEQNNNMHVSGVISNGKDAIVVDKNIKDTTDISLNISTIKTDAERTNIFYSIFNGLQRSLDLYIEKYPGLNDVYLQIDDLFNIQKYQPGQHFKNPHFESSTLPKRKRILTWMVYLNDVKDGGNTVFPYFDLEFKPTKGHILIWPADYTHTHFGDIVKDEKYIMTGWFNVSRYDYAQEKMMINKFDEKEVTYFSV
jgi:hypothetical protein